MNKKVLTLCAGFLLAGGMLSTLSAEKLSAVADNGKYYKMNRKAVYLSTTTKWQANTDNYYLNLNDSKDGGISTPAEDYWRVVSVPNGYQLINLKGDVLSFNSNSTFGINENLSGTAADGYTQLQSGSVWVGYESTDDDGDGFYALADQADFTDAYGMAFDAEATPLELVHNNNFEEVVKGAYYEISTINGVVGDGQYKAVDAGNGQFSFQLNTKDGNGSNLTFGTIDKFELVSVGVAGQYVLKVGEDQYISFDGTNGKVVDSVASATIFAFDEVDTTTQLCVGDLVYYELDGFSLNITYGDNKEVAGNPFKGHLTPMAYVGGRFIKANDAYSTFYLKNEAGEYIVAKLYSKGNTPAQDVYTFTTVKENELLHYLSDFNNDKDPAYYSYFSAYSYDYKLNKKDLDVLDEFKVSLPNGNAAISRYEIDGIWTLAASVATNMEEVTVAVKGATLVQAKDLLKQKKFFTVVKKSSTNKYEDLGWIVAADRTTQNNSGYDAVNAYGNVLEGQWAITYNKDNNLYTFTNRENTTITFNLNGDYLYTTDTPNEYRYDIYTNGIRQYTITYEIAEVAEHHATDGYETLKNLKNVKFNIGYASGVYGNAWFTENHEGVNNHTIGLDTDVENALVFTATEYADAKKRVETPVHGYVYVPSDSIYVVSTIGYINAKDEYKEDKDTLKVVSYSFVNQWNEPLIYAGIKDKYVSSVNEKVSAQKFALRQDGERLNLRPVYLTTEESWSADDLMYNTFDNKNDLYKMYAGDAANGILDNVTLYDRTENDYFVVEPTDVPMYRPVINPLDTISIYRNDNSRSLLYEKGEFLGMENIADFTDMNPAFLADTAYVRYDTYRPQYMLVVGAVKHEETTYCPDHGIGATCQHADTVPGWVEGRYLVNLKDTAIAWDEANKHKDGNPYINSEKFYKLGFVQAKHIGDSLMIEAVKPTAADTINVGTEDFNVAKFAFRYVDTEAQSFVIETANYKKLNERNAGARDGEGYLKWMNGVVVVVDDIENADVYNMNENETRTPTANESITAEGAVSVVATDGAVVIKGAEGKNVVIATILGKVVANETINSDNETIAVPAGIAVVSVDGESFKVVVK